jgi:hypothetical protein
MKVILLRAQNDIPALRHYDTRTGRGQRYQSVSEQEEEVEEEEEEKQT